MMVTQNSVVYHQNCHFGRVFFLCRHTHVHPQFPNKTNRGYLKGGNGVYATKQCVSHMRSHLA